MAISFSWQTIRSFTVPAGSYTVSGKVQVGNRATNQGANVFCILAVGGTTEIDRAAANFLAAYPQNGSSAMLPLQGAFTSASPTVVSLQCSIDNQGNGITEKGSLIAVQNGNVTFQ